MVNVAFTIFAPDLLLIFLQSCDIFAGTRLVQIHFFRPMKGSC